MLNINRKLSQKGFSLIELMVAVVILAMAIFGIFHAYSVGFMGMADARDRTVATNYLQQTIEDFKNMNFNQVQNDPITPIPGTKFSRGTYVLNLEEIDGVVTLKNVISQVRWVDRKGNIKTEKASTIIYNKPATSEVGDEAVELVLYAQSYYTIMPTKDVSLVAEIKDENGNIYDYDGEIIFSVVTVRVDGIPIQVGDITTESPIYANDGVAYCTFTAISEAELAALGGDVEGTERIQATATIAGEDLIDTVNIRVTTGPVGIVIEPVSEEDDRVLAAGAGVESNLKLYVVKADYDTPVGYDSPITLSADGPGTLSETTITTPVPTDGYDFSLTSDGTSGVVEITASAPNLDIGYIEITFTGPPASILITPDKNSIYPGEDIGITVTIVDENNVSVEYNEVVNLSADPDYGSFSPNSLDFASTELLELKSTFTAYTSATPGETITIHANSGSISGSTEILILSLLTPKYLELDAYPLSVDLVGGGTNPTITATVTDVNGATVTTYSTPITFYAKNGLEDFGTFSEITKTPTDGEAVVTLTSTFPGTATITASSDDLILRPEEGREVVFYQGADHIELSAYPTSIEANVYETSIITATVCDAGGNEVVNYSDNILSPKSITFTSTLGKFHILGELPNAISDSNEITVDEFDGGVAIVEFYSETSSETPAEISAESNDFLSDDGHVFITLSGDIPSVLTLGDVSNLNDYEIHFGITVTGSPLYLKVIKIEWDNKQAVLDKIIIRSPFGEEPPLSITTTDGLISPCTENIIPAKKLVIDELSDIGLIFSIARMKDNNITVTFTDTNGTEYSPISFIVPK